MAYDYFTAEELLTRLGNGNDQKFSEADCLEAAEFIVGVIERELGTSFIARTVTDEPHDGGSDRILLNQPYVLSVTSVTVDGSPVSGTPRVRGGVLRVISGGTPVPFASGYDNVLVTYQSGYSAEPPPDVKTKALDGARARLLSTSPDSGINSRATSQTTEQGVLNYVVAGLDNPTGWPEFDAMLLSWKERLDVLGFA